MGEDHFQERESVCYRLNKDPSYCMCWKSGVGSVTVRGSLSQSVIISATFSNVNINYRLYLAPIDKFLIPRAI